MDSGPHAIASATELDQVRRQGCQVRMKALGLAMALTFLTLLVPVF